MDQKVKRLLSKSKSASTGYLDSLKEEFRKITWTKKKELVKNTKAVVLSVFVFGMAIYLVDLLIRGFLDSIKWGAHFLLGV